MKRLVLVIAFALTTACGGEESLLSLDEEVGSEQSGKFPESQATEATAEEPADPGISEAEPGIEPETEPAEPDIKGRQPAPVVLMHGMAGFDSLGPAEYFYGVVDAAKRAGLDVHITVVDPFHSSEVRAKQAARQIDEILARTGARKVHLVGHSQGGLDARRVVAGLGYGDRVATVTTIGTPHRGTKICDLALGLLPGNSEAAIGAIADVLLVGITRRDADLTAQITEMSARYMEEVFNPANPDDPRVEYYSVAGVTQPFYWVDLRKTDVVDELLRASYSISWLLEGSNDGLVPVTSQKWGEVLGEVQADHLDQMGWLPLQPQPAFDHKAFYLKLFRWLRTEGPRPL